MPSDRIMSMVVVLAILGFCFAAGIAAGYLLWGRQVVHVDEPVAVEQHMDDGSVVLHREQGGKIVTPAPERPAGHKPVRTIEVEVMPPPVEVAPGECQRTVTCPPVTVRLDLLRAEDGTYRAQASSHDGTILSGIDVPLEPALVVIPRPWAAGMTYDGERGGAFLHRDIGRLRVGFDSDGETKRFAIGWRF
jgi:hypothetical protein